MSPAWTGVLGYSSYWAMGEDTSDRANRALTDALYSRGHYNGGYETGYTSNESDTGETFHPKSFRGDSRCPWGQCNDFADFLICLSTSVGASEMKSQRTNQLDAGGFRFKTLKPAGWSTWLQSYSWAYHQFALLSSNVWDGCIYLDGFGVPKDWARDTTYQTRLVDELIGSWSPTPSGGFVPEITTASP
jgi:hypothetical protein